MTIEHANVTGRTGETYTTATNPTSTQVTAFITAAKNMVKGANGGTAVDESDQVEIEIVLDVCEILISNYKVDEKNKGSNNISFPPEKKILPVIGDALQVKIDNWWSGGDTNPGSSFSYGWS
jgi:hypothetical protein